MARMNVREMWKAKLEGKTVPASTSHAPAVARQPAVAGMLPGSSSGATVNQTTNSFQTIPGLEMYSFQYAQPYLKAQYQGLDSITDIVSLAFMTVLRQPAISSRAMC